ncbi:MAG TPA: hypothetical protein EYH54_01840 [Nautiliaceae bacterium]|nr:hypothetical protein [Nautiliaceae bacterium]
MKILKKKSFVLADFVYGISLLIVAIVLGIFVGKISVNFKENMERTLILQELREFGTIQIIYPQANYIINKKIFDLKIFSLKDIKLKYKIFFLGKKEVNFCSQDIYSFKKGLNIIPLDLSDCINESEGIIRISLLFENNLANVYDIKYSNKSSNLEFVNLPLRNLIIIGSEVFEGLPELYYSTDADLIYYEIISPYYFDVGTLSLNPGDTKKIDPTTFNYKNLTFSLGSIYYNSVFSIYLNGFYLGTVSPGESLTISYRDDFKIRSLEIYEGGKLLGKVENTKLLVTNNKYEFSVKEFDICLVDADNRSIKVPGFIRVKNTEKIYYTETGNRRNCVIVPLAFAPDITSHIIEAYSLDYKKYNKITVTERSNNNIVIPLY